MNYLEELLKTGNTEMLNYLLELGIVKIDTAVDEAISLKNGTYIYNLAMAIQDLRLLSNENVVITPKLKQESIERLACALVELKDVNALANFLKVISYAKPLVAGEIIASNDAQKISELINYLFICDIQGWVYNSSDKEQFKKIRNDIFKRASRALIDGKHFNTLINLIISNRESNFQNIALSVANEEFLNYFKDYITKTQDHKNKAIKEDKDLDNLGYIVNQSLRNLQMKNGTILDEDAFDYLKVLYKRNDRATILNYKDVFARLFQGNPEKGLTK